jgi:AAA15 family ATPase/GTPase
MWVSKLLLTNLKGFIDSEYIDLSQSINVLVGANNAGKSTILQAVHFLQGNFLTHTDIRKGEGRAEIHLNLEGNDLEKFHLRNGGVLFSDGPGDLNRYLRIEIDSAGNINKKFTRNDNQQISFNEFLPLEPGNLIYPYLSKRKVVSYNQTINSAIVNTVNGTLENLSAKVDRLNNPELPANKSYVEYCKKIFGYTISASHSEGGKKAGLTVDNFTHIPLESMGEGVPNMLGLICDLCLAENQIFLIEEIENDIHPQSLKELLNLIIEKSGTNQFIISTHSNIVTKALGSVNRSKIFNITMSFTEGERKLPISKVSLVGDDPESRRIVLEELGYEFNDYELWSAWLFLEESSAEILVREHFIRWFAPELTNKLRTFSSRTASEVEPKFEDFNRLFVYLHLTKVYRNCAWVVIDEGKEEAKIISKMKEYYVKDGWNENNFRQLSRHDFEEYYPEEFKDKFAAIMTVEKDKRRNLKKELLKEVIGWINKDDEQAKEKFSESAKEVILLLKEISSSQR